MANADELGAHVSAAGGVDRAPERAREIDAHVLQLFTKQPNRWAEPSLTPDRIEAFRAAVVREEIRFTVSHDSYLINLASPDPALWQRSCESFQSELERCEALGLNAMVTHPGNATDKDLESGVARNADGLARALDAVPGEVRILLEITAGSGTSIGGSFAHLAGIRDAVPAEHRARVGFCFDTCHALAAGYDLVGGYESVFEEFDDTLGLDSIGLFHLNDSVGGLGSHRDRHAHIGQGELGVEPFRRLMCDARFASIPKVLETPKGEDVGSGDRMNLTLLRSLRSS